jgi:hypothetical protein
VQLLSFPSHQRTLPSTSHLISRSTLAKGLVAGGVVAYNWWVVVPFVPGLMPSVNGFFSDLEATGRPHATLMADADFLAGVLMVSALLVRGARAQGGVRREWKWLMVFSLAGAIGGRYTYACSEGLSAACRNMEWHLQLPIHHYVHVVSGIVEFGALTGAAVIAMRRTHGDGTPEARIYSGVVKALAFGYPLLAAVYLTDRLGTLVEPIFFVAFSVMIMTEVFEPMRRASGHELPSWAERVAARGSAPDRVSTPAN